MNPLANQINIKDIRLPIQYIVTGIVFFVLSQIVLLNGTKSIVNGIAQSPYIWSAAHLLLLGFAVIVAIGAMYQLVPVALQAEIYSLKLGYIHYYSLIIGILGMGFSFITMNLLALVIFGAITVVSILLFIYNMWRTIDSASRSLIKIAVLSSLTYFLLTIILGIWLAFDMYQPHLMEWHQIILKLHILFGVIGWFTFLILGFSLKLLPMFTLSHGYESKLSDNAIYCLHAGIVLTGLGIILDIALCYWIGVIVILLGMIFFCLQVRIILSKRLRKNLDLGVVVAIIAYPIAGIGVIIIGLFGLIINGEFPFVATIYFVIMAWITLSILAYLFKIIPFLWWTYKYSNTIGKEKVPGLKGMINEKNGKLILNLFIIGFTINSLAIVISLPTLFLIVQCFIIVLSIWYFIEATLVFKK